MQRSPRFQRALHHLAAFAALQLCHFGALATMQGQTPNVFAWGLNSSGQTNVPPTLTDAIAVAAGEGHTLALRANGTVVAWGLNNEGQTNVPANLTGVVAIAAGGNHSLAVKNDGTVVAWGSNGNGQTNVPPGLTGVVAVAGGGFHSIALKGDGTLVAWGLSNFGQAVIPGGLTGVKAIAAGYQHNVALKSDGTVVAWGWNSWGTTNVPPGLTGVVAVAAGVKHSLAVKSDGTVVTWGTVFDVPAGLNAKAIASGFHNALALKTDGTVAAWGFQFYGETTVPPGVAGIEAVAAGYYHFVVLRAAPVLYDTLGAPPQLQGGGSPVTDASHSALATRFSVTGGTATLTRFDLALSTLMPNNITVSIYRDGVGVPGQGGALGALVATNTFVDAQHVCIPGLVAGSPDSYVNQTGDNVCNAPGIVTRNVPVFRGTMPGSVLLTPGDYWLAVSSSCGNNNCAVWYTTPHSGTGAASLSSGTNTWSSSMDAPWGMRLYGAVDVLAAPVSVTVGTSPDGIGFTVDSVSYSAITMFNWAQNQQHWLEARFSQTVSGTEYLFDKWSDGVTTRARVITVGTAVNYTANYKVMPERTWVRKSPVTSPPDRSLAGLAPDRNGRMMLFGGRSDSTGGGSLGDTWMWDGAAWSQIAPIGPLARSGHAMTFHAGHGLTMLFGGYRDALLNDTWMWDGTSWLSRGRPSDPAPRSGQAMVHDAARQQLVMFGGNDGTGQLSDTWIWEGCCWTPRMVTGPSAREGHAMAYDAIRQQVVLFGGRDDSGSGFNGETWLWNGTSWTQSVAPGPPARANAGMAFDALHGHVVLFGGESNMGALQDTWVWDGAAWKQMTPGSSPPGRFGAAMAYDPKSKAVVLFGGSGNLNDTWVWTEAQGTPTGTNVTTQPDNAVNLTFGSVVAAGTTTATSSSSGTPPPSGFSLGNPPVYYELTTTATYSGAITVCISYAGISFTSVPPSLFHYEGGSWNNVTTLQDTVNQVVCGAVTSLSPFALFGSSDTTPPVITPAITGVLGTNGWRTSNVNVSWTVQDPESGIASQSGCGPRALTADTAGTTITCSAANGLGLTSSVPVTVKIDKTAPSISGMPAAGCSLWPANGKLVQVAIVTASDAMSGIHAFSVTGTSNEPSNPKDPDIVITPAAGGGYAVQLRADRLGTGAGRTYTLTATATDRAGNVTAATAACIVPHDKR